MSIFSGNLRQLATNPHVAESELASMFDVSPARMDVLLHEARRSLETLENLETLDAAHAEHAAYAEQVENQRGNQTENQMENRMEYQNKNLNLIRNNVNSFGENVDSTGENLDKRNTSQLGPSQLGQFWSKSDSDKIRACVVELLTIFSQRVQDRNSWLLFGRTEIVKFFEMKLAQVGDACGVHTGGGIRAGSSSGGNQSNQSIGVGASSSDGIDGGVSTGVSNENVVDLAFAYRLYRSLFSRLLRLLLLDELAGSIDEEEKEGGKDFWDCISVLEYGAQRMRLTKVERVANVDGKVGGTGNVGEISGDVVVRNDDAGKIYGENGFVKEWTPSLKTNNVGEKQKPEKSPGITGITIADKYAVTGHQSLQNAFLLHHCPLQMRVISPGVFLLGEHGKQFKQFSIDKTATTTTTSSSPTTTSSPTTNPRNESHNESRKDFHLNHPYHLRWMRLSQPNRQLFLQLAVKFRLHPLAVEDALASWESHAGRLTVYPLEVHDLRYDLGRAAKGVSGGIMFEERDSSGASLGNIARTPGMNGSNNGNPGINGSPGIPGKKSILDGAHWFMRFRIFRLSAGAKRAFDAIHTEIARSAKEARQARREGKEGAKIKIEDGIKDADEYLRDSLTAVVNDIPPAVGIEECSLGIFVAKTWPQENGPSAPARPEDFVLTIQSAWVTTRFREDEADGEGNAGLTVKGGNDGGKKDDAGKSGKNESTKKATATSGTSSGNENNNNPKNVEQTIKQIERKARQSFHGLFDTEGDGENSTTDSQNKSNNSQNKFQFDDFEQVHIKLRHSASILRQADALWLLYAILNHTVDQMLPIGEALQTHLTRVSQRLYVSESKMAYVEVKSLILLRRHVEWLHSELRPLLKVLKFVEDKVEKFSQSQSQGGDQEQEEGQGESELSRYLEDVEDALVTLCDQLQSQCEQCDSLFAEYGSYSDREQNNVLYTLTIVTAVVTPLQCFSGYFGMNFVDDDGKPRDPVLTWETGPLFFWLLTGVCTGLLMLWLGMRTNWKFGA